MKSVLVIDTPKACRECRLLDDDNWYCMGYHEACDLSGIHNRPSWCPLKGMPHELEHDGGRLRTADIYHDGYVDGWNYLLSLLEEDE